MKTEDVKDVSYIVFESTIARFDRVIKRLWISILILVFLLVGTNIGWLYYQSQFETITETTQDVKQDTTDGGSNSFVGGDNYGSSEDSNSN
jgi:uncharacterized membrane protein SpoIIM required for sporulation